MAEEKIFGRQRSGKFIVRQPKKYLRGLPLNTLMEAVIYQYYLGIFPEFLTPLSNYFFELSETLKANDKLSIAVING